MDDDFVSPNEAAAAFSRWFLTERRNALLRVLFPEGVRPFEAEKVVARIRKHYPEVPRAEIYRMPPWQLAEYLRGVVEAEAEPTANVADDATGPWSKPDTPKRWAKVFGVSVDTIKRRFTSGEIPNRKLSDRSYMVRLDCIPADK